MRPRIDTVGGKSNIIVRREGMALSLTILRWSFLGASCVLLLMTCGREEERKDVYTWLCGESLSNCLGRAFSERQGEMFVGTRKDIIIKEWDMWSCPFRSTIAHLTSSLQLLWWSRNVCNWVIYCLWIAWRVNDRQMVVSSCCYTSVMRNRFSLHVTFDRMLWSFNLIKMDKINDVNWFINTDQIRFT